MACDQFVSVHVRPATGWCYIANFTAPNAVHCDGGVNEGFRDSPAAFVVEIASSRFDVLSRLLLCAGVDHDDFKVVLIRPALQARDKQAFEEVENDFPFVIASANSVETPVAPLALDPTCQLVPDIRHELPIQSIRRFDDDGLSVLLAVQTQARFVDQFVGLCIHVNTPFASEGLRQAVATSPETSRCIRCFL